MAKLTEEQKQQRAETRRKNKELKEIEEKKKTHEEYLKKSLKEARLYRNVNARRKFKVGQEVVLIGHNWRDCIIKEVLDNGNTYLIEYVYKNNNYGNPTFHKAEAYKNWSEIKEVNGKVSSESFQKKSSLHYNLSFSNRQVEDLFSKAYHFGVDMNPEYQRDYVWDEENKIALIDSMFKGIDIGKFVFIVKDYDTVNEPLFEVLDGKQRMTTILDFFNDGFQYKGFYFSELKPEDQRYLSRYTVSMAETKEELSNKEKYEYFLSLNISGVPQTEEQIKKVKKLLEKEK